MTDTSHDVLSGPTLSRRAVLGGTIAAAAVVGLAPPAVAATRMTIVDSGGAAATVVVAADADEQTRHAADVLVDHIAEATGARLPVVTTDDAVTGPRVVIGTALPGSGVSTDELAGLAPDAYLLRRSGDILTIAGRDGWGNRFGVYEFLERHLDVRWLMPDGIIEGQIGKDVPHRSGLSIAAVDRTDTPAFGCRIIPPFPTPSASRRGEKPWTWDWTSTNRSWQARDMVSWARQARVHESLEFMHMMYQVIPPEKYGDPAKPDTYHPEFFPIHDGETYIPPANRTSGWQPRFSAPGIADAAADWAIAFLRANPEVTSYSLSVNDGVGYSEDDEEDGVLGSNGRPTVSKAYYAFVNAVAAKVAQEFPEARCGVIAYNEAIDPPPFDLDEHVVPVLVVPTYRWMDDDLRAADQQWVDAWGARATQLGWWDRVYGVPYCVPHMDLTTVADTLRYLRDLGVTAVLGETRSVNYSWGEGPKLSVYTDLLWDPDRSPRRLVHDWCQHAVGPRAGAHLEAYYRLWERFWVHDAPTTDWFAGTSYTPSFRTAGYLEAVTDDQVAQSRRHIDRAAAAVTTPEQALRMDVLSRDFDFYEASALSYPKHVGAPADDDAAIDLFDRAAGRIDRDTALARNRLVLGDYFATGGPKKGPLNYDVIWTGWNLYAVWRLAEHIRAAAGARVREHIQARLAADESPNVRLLARMVLDLADGNTITPISNGSFESGTDDWILNAPPDDVARVAVSSDLAHTGTTSLRLPDGYVGGVMQTVDVHPGFFRLHAHLYVPGDELPQPSGIGVGRGQYASLLSQFYDADGQRVRQIRDVFSLEHAVGTWHEIAQSDLLEEGIVSARVRVIVQTVGPAHVDDIAVTQTTTAQTIEPWFADSFDDEAVGDEPTSWLALTPRSLEVRDAAGHGRVLTAACDRPGARLDLVRPFAEVHGSYQFGFAIRRTERTRCEIRLEESMDRRAQLRLLIQANTVLYWDGDAWANPFHPWSLGSWIDVMVTTDAEAGTYTVQLDGTEVGTGRLVAGADHVGKLWVIVDSPADGGEALSLDQVFLRPAPGV